MQNCEPNAPTVFELLLSYQIYKYIKVLKHFISCEILYVSYKNRQIITWKLHQIFVCFNEMVLPAVLYNNSPFTPSHPLLLEEHTDQ